MNNLSPRTWPGPFNVAPALCLDIYLFITAFLGGVTVYHYWPRAIMTQIEGFTVKRSAELEAGRLLMWDFEAKQA